MKITVVYTMKGCPFCTMIKEELEKENLPFQKPLKTNMSLHLCY